VSVTIGLPVDGEADLLEMFADSTQHDAKALKMVHDEKLRLCSFMRWPPGRDHVADLERGKGAVEQKPPRTPTA